MTPNNKTIEILLEIERVTTWNASIEACVGRLKKEFAAPEVVIELIRKEKK